MDSAARSEVSNNVQIIEDKASQNSEHIMSVIYSLKKKVSNDRIIYIKKKLEDNKQRLSSITGQIYNFAKIRANKTAGDTGADEDLLSRRQVDTICTLNTFEPANVENDGNNSLDENSHVPSAALFGSSNPGKNGIQPIKLPEISKLPPYTTWVFLDRNQRMTDDQSVVGRRRIYYDPSCGEALICSDSEDDAIEEEEEKREFRNVEDFIIRMTIHEVGLSDDVLELLAQFLEKKPCEIKARHESFLAQKTEHCIEKNKSNYDRDDNVLSDKDLDAALDSFDNLFCRRCLVFDCRLHGCSQDLVFPAERQQPLTNFDEGVPCSNHCYRLASNIEGVAALSTQISCAFKELTFSSSPTELQHSAKKKLHDLSIGRQAKSQQTESASSNAKGTESGDSDVQPHENCKSSRRSSSPTKVNFDEKSGVLKRNNKRAAERVLLCMRKRQRKIVQGDSDTVATGSLLPQGMKLRALTRKYNKDPDPSTQRKEMKSLVLLESRNRELSSLNSMQKVTDESSNESNEEITIECSPSIDDQCLKKSELIDENICKDENTDVHSWKVIEKSLFSKGVEIFGRNSCLIARNLLNGMRTCMEVFNYINFVESKGACEGDGSDSLIKGHIKGNELRTRSRYVRRRGRVRKLKYTWKSAFYHSIRKRISERKDQPCRQYNPCGCQTPCGKQCPCVLNGTCCEKYCGCTKMCKNRFRGCHCAKSQCRSRQCPCFAAARECDPDVCRNCWVGCGDGSLGGPNQRGDNYECRNMKLLLKQQQRVLLGRSDVSGWGAFLKNGVGKNEYLGEYTGEIISHREADKRGKIYDRENSSFLFNLNDQNVLDAYRKGDKLKFANHSPDPNCYAKVIMVAGDHRVGIFAKERISTGEELFYDYRYEADRAPAWARKPEASGTKKDDTYPFGGRAKKLA